MLAISSSGHNYSTMKANYWHHRRPTSRSSAPQPDTTLTASVVIQSMLKYSTHSIYLFFVPSCLPSLVSLSLSHSTQLNSPHSLLFFHWNTTLRRRRRRRAKLTIIMSESIETYIPSLFFIFFCTGLLLGWMCCCIGLLSCVGLLLWLVNTRRTAVLLEC